MERVTVRLPKGQLDKLEELSNADQYPNRSEAVRDAVRRLLVDEYERSATDAELPPKQNWTSLRTDGGRR